MDPLPPTSLNPDKPKQHNPIIMGLLNILTLGAPYIFFRRYKRFIGLIILLFIINAVNIWGLTSSTSEWIGGVLSLFQNQIYLLFSFGLLSHPLEQIDYLSYAIVLLVSVDTYFLCKGINNETKSIGMKNTPAKILAGLFVTVVFLSLLPLNPYKYSVPPENLLYRSPSQQAEISQKINSIGLDVSECEKNGDIANPCYFKKALEENQLQYCLQYWGESEAGECLHGLALASKDASICEKISFEYFRSECITDIAAHTGDISLCSSSKDQRCQNIAELCQTSDTSNPDYQAYCVSVTLVDKILNRYSDCDFSSPTNQQACLNDFEALGTLMGSKLGVQNIAWDKASIAKREEIRLTQAKEEKENTSNDSGSNSSPSSS